MLVSACCFFLLENWKIDKTIFTLRIRLSTPIFPHALSRIPTFLFIENVRLVEVFI